MSLQRTKNAIIVAKFGGSSLASVAHIKNAAKIISKLIKDEYHLVVVVSAMLDETNRLIDLSQQFQDISNNHYNTVVSTGEQVATGLFAAALEELSHDTITLQAWQIPIITDNNNKKARIKQINANKITELLSENKTVVIPGFQGINCQGEITSLGRGGSDITTVALAAALDSQYCYLYKDVDGILSADPKIIDSPQILNNVRIEEMLESSSLGAEVLHPRSLEIAMNNLIDLKIIPTFNASTGGNTEINSNTDIECKNISNIICNDNEVKLSLKSIPNSPVINAKLFDSLAQANINVDMILQNKLTQELAQSDLAFTIADTDLSKTETIILSLKQYINFESIQIQQRVSKVSIVGVGMRGHASIAAIIYHTLAELGICDYGVTTTEIKISILIAQDYAHILVKALYSKFFA